MTHKEFEQRKRALDEQLQAAMKIVQDSYRVQLRALELVRWSETLSPEGPPPVESLALVRPATARTLLLPEPEPEPEPPQGGLYWLIAKAFDQLPEELTRDDVMSVLGFAPHRSSLYRILQELAHEGSLEVVELGKGHAPTIYRKVRAPEIEDY
jgi:hypothetical protein